MLLTLQRLGSRSCRMGIDQAGPFLVVVELRFCGQLHLRLLLKHLLLLSRKRAIYFPHGLALACLMESALILGQLVHHVKAQYNQ